MAAPVPVPSSTGPKAVVVANPLATVVNSAAAGTVTRARAVERAFRSRPILTSALAVSYLYWFCLLISTWNNWYIASGSVSGFSISGGVSLFSSRMCITYGSRTSSQPGRSCVSIDLIDIATIADYLRVAGGVAFAFLLLALMTGMLATSLTHTHRVGGDALASLPRHAQSRLVLAGLHGVTCLFALISWSSYVGVINSNYSTASFAAGTGFTVSTVGLGPGAGLAIVGWILSSAALALTIMSVKETGDAAPATAGEAFEVAATASAVSVAYPGSSAPEWGAGAQQPVSMPYGSYKSDYAAEQVGLPASMMPPPVPPRPVPGRGVNDVYVGSQQPFDDTQRHL